MTQLKSQLKSDIDGDAPFFLRAPLEKRLSKVNNELQTRASEDGNKLSDDNKKTEEKSKDDMKADAKSGAEEAKAGKSEAQKGTSEMKSTASESEADPKRYRISRKEIKSRTK